MKHKWAICEDVCADCGCTGSQVAMFPDLADACSGPKARPLEYTPPDVSHEPYRCPQTLDFEDLLFTPTINSKTL